MEFAYISHLVGLIAIYAVLTMAFTVAMGRAGVVNFAHVALFGVGAYTSAILTTRFDVSWWIAFVAAVAAAGLVSAVLSVLLRRVRGDFVAVIALMMALAMNEIFLNLEITRGALGIVGIPKPALAATPLAFTILVVVVCIVVFLVLTRILHSPFGRVLGAVRDDEIAARVLGKDTAHVKRTILIATGAIAGLAGALIASFIGFIDPQSFYLVDLMAVVSAAVIGGVGSLAGSVVGIAIYFLLPEFMRLLTLDADIVGAARMIVFAIFLLAIILVRPRGLFGTIDLD